MYNLDFSAGQFGHFLEFVINKYIFCVPHTIENIFQEDTGASHLINFDTVYQNNKIISCGHYTSANFNYDKNINGVIWIKPDSKYDFVNLVNIFNRCSEAAVNNKVVDIKSLQNEHLTSISSTNMTNQQLRNNWYAKLMTRDFFDSNIQCKSTKLPVYNFNYSSFFNFIEFINELQKTSKFLESKFRYDPSLFSLWNQFIEKNQGFKKYSFARGLLTSALQRVEEKIDIEDWQCQSYINFKLSKMFDIYEGDLHSETISYPDNTISLYELILKNIDEFDNYF